MRFTVNSRCVRDNEHTSDTLVPVANSHAGSLNTVTWLTGPASAECTVHLDMLACRQASGHALPSCEDVKKSIWSHDQKSFCLIKFHLRTRNSLQVLSELRISPRAFTPLLFVPLLVAPDERSASSRKAHEWAPRGNITIPAPACAQSSKLGPMVSEGFGASCIGRQNGLLVFWLCLLSLVSRHGTRII